MKLLTVTVPCYNSQDYMENCIASLLPGGEDMEILIVDDGSSDETAAIADRLQAAHPSVIRAIHQENKGHGGAVTTGLLHASGLYFKVVDSDDWVDVPALQEILQEIRKLVSQDQIVDLIINNYIYDKVGISQHTIRYTRSFQEKKVLQWDDVGHFYKWENLLMHALIYRTEILRGSSLYLPEHTFYVDNLYASVPLANVSTLYYVNADLYHYFIGREGQSVQESTMIRRIDQQILVNRLMMDELDLEHIENIRQQKTILHYHDIVTAVTSIMLIVSGTPEHLQKKEDLWNFIRDQHPWEYRKLRHSLFGITVHLPGSLGRRTAISAYRLANRIFNFN